MKTLLTLLVGLTTWVSVNAQAVGCNHPIRETDLELGGTYCGNSSIDIGKALSIRNKVVWNGGTLRLTGDNGDIILYDTLHIKGGSIESTDGEDGAFIIKSGGVLIIDSAARLFVDDEVAVNSNAKADVHGMIQTNNDVRVHLGGDMNLSSTGQIVTSGGGDDVKIFGNLMINGGSILADDIGLYNDLNLQAANLQARKYLTIKNARVNMDSLSTFLCYGFDLAGDLYATGNVIVTGDIEIQDGALTIGPGGYFDVGDDLKIENGGTLDLEAGGYLSVLDNVVNNSSSSGSGTASQAIIYLCDTMHVGGDFTLENTTPNSSVCGCETSALIVQGTFQDNEDESCDFVDCGGNGEICTPSTMSIFIGLPVTWLGFDADLISENTVKLDWSTAAEINNSGFYIERADDSKVFEEIAFVEGAGNVNETRSYSFTDLFYGSGTRYYRLRQVDFDGKTEYSEVRMVSTHNQMQTKVYPNPANEYVNIELEGNSMEMIRLFDLSGKQLMEEPINERRSLKLEFPSSVGSGTYLISVPGANGSEMKKLTINR